MRTSYQIYCDYVRAITKANRIEGVARTLNTVSNRYLSDEIDNLSQQWQGDAIHIVRSKGAEISTSITDQARNLFRLADTMRAIARRNYNAEMRALELARIREGER